MVFTKRTCPRIPRKALEGEPPKKSTKITTTTTTPTTTKKGKISISPFREKKRCWFVRGIQRLKKKIPFGQEWDLKEL